MMFSTLKRGLVGGVAAVLLAGGFYAGMTFANGRHNASDLAKTRAQLKDATATLAASGKHWQQAVAQFRTDSAALNATAEEYAHERATQAVFGRSLSARLDAALAARPGLAACNVGADGLRIWNDANRGSASASPAAGAPDQPDPAAAVPGAPAGRQRQPARAIEKPLAGNRAVSRLRGTARADDQRGAEATGHRSQARGSPSIALITGAHE